MMIIYTYTETENPREISVFGMIRFYKSIICVN